MLTAALLISSGSAGYTLAGPATPTAVMQPSMLRSSRMLMQADVVKEETPWNDPREGKPFGEADGAGRPIGKVRSAVEAPLSRAISDATVLKPQYIEVDDEPW